MAAFAKEHGFTFPCLYDETQEAAIAFKAVCTPDFFLYDKDLKLVCCGQFDSSRPRTEHSTGPRTELPVSGEDLRSAADALVAGEWFRERGFGFAYHTQNDVWQVLDDVLLADELFRIVDPDACLVELDPSGALVHGIDWMAVVRATTRRNPVPSRSPNEVGRLAVARYGGTDGPTDAGTGLPVYAGETFSFRQRPEEPLLASGACGAIAAKAGKRVR